MEGKGREFWRGFIFFFLVILISQWLVAAREPQESQVLRDFLEYCKQNYFSKVEKVQVPDWATNVTLEAIVENLSADEYAKILGYAYRLQWDKVLQMPENTEKEKDEKYGRKVHMEQLWWELRDHVSSVGDKMKQKGKKISGDIMVKNLDEGFWIRGLDKKVIVHDLSLVTSIFEVDVGGGGGDDSYDDVAVNKLQGWWMLDKRYLSTGEKSHKGVYLGIQKSDYGLDASDNRGSIVKHWKLTDDGKIILMNWNGTVICELYRERKNYWSGIMLDKTYGQIKYIFHRERSLE